MVNFLGNVVVEKDDSSLLAQKMILLYNEKDDKKTQTSENEETEIKRIDAFGNVKIFSDEFIGSGDKGYYEPSENIFVLQENVIINNGSSIATGDEFVYNTITKKGHFVGRKDETTIRSSGGDKRVVVIIGESDKDKEKK